MRKITFRGFCFWGVFFFLLVGLGWCQDGGPLELEPIIVSRQRANLLNSYSIFPQWPAAGALSSPVEALRQAPVDLLSRSPQGAVQTDFSLRGSSFQGVMVGLQGQRINDPQTAHHNSDIPLTSEDVETIEVMPAVSSALMGGDAIGGAINFRLKNPWKRKMIFKTSVGENKSGGALFSLSDKLGNLGARLSLENQESGGFRPGVDFKKFTSSGYLRYELPAGNYEASFGYQEKEFSAYDFYTPQSGFFSKEWTKTYLLNTGFDLQATGLRLKPNFVFRRHFDKFMLDKTQIRSRYLNHHRTDVITPSLYLQKEFRSLGRLGAGLEYGQETITSTNLGKHRREHASVYLDDSKELFPRLFLGGALRFDDYQGDGGVTTGSFSLKYKLGEKCAFSAGVSRSQRQPSFTELYYSDPTTNGATNLSAEKALNYQLGYDYNNEGVSWGGAIFYRAENDFIDWIKRAPSQARWQAENIDEARVWGIEEYAKFKFNRILGLDINYTYINKRIDSPGYLYKYGPSYARHLMNSRFIAQLPWGTQSLGVSYKQRPFRRGWLLVDCTLCRNLNKNSQVFAEVENLLNVEYQDIVGVPQPGRCARLGLRLAW